MITLTDLAKNSQDKVVQGFVNEMATDSYLLSTLPFDNCMTPSGTSDLVYGYKRLNSFAEAHFRTLGQEPTKSEIGFEQVKTNLAILSDSFDIDRVAAEAANDLYAEKLSEVKNSIIRGFNKQVVAGEKGSNAFDGLATILKGKSTEVKGTASLTTISDKDEALKFAADMDNVLSMLMRDANVILVSRSTKNKMNAAARLIGMGTTTQDGAGNRISAWDAIPLQVVEGMKDGDIIPVVFGMDAFHGITLKGGNAISVHLPDFNAPGAVKTGDAEFVCGCALKNTKGAGILHLAAAPLEKA